MSIQVFQKRQTYFQMESNLYALKWFSHSQRKKVRVSFAYFKSKIFHISLAYHFSSYKNNNDNNNNDSKKVILDFLQCVSGI